MKPPDFLNKYFWDVDPRLLTIERDARFIMERVLENGDDQAVAWLKESFSESDLKNVVRESRRLSLKSRNYWGLMFHVWSTKHPLARMPEKIWHH